MNIFKAVSMPVVAVSLAILAGCAPEPLSTAGTNIAVQANLSATPIASGGNKLTWIGPGSDFRIDFLHVSPCDPHNSHLTGTAERPAWCNVLSSAKGPFMYQVGSGLPDKPVGEGPVNSGPILLVRVGSCDSCGISAKNVLKMTPVKSNASSPSVGIYCDSQDKTTKTDPADVVASYQSLVQWVTLGSYSTFTVTFTGTSPCTNGSTFNQGSPVCAMGQGTGTSTYNVTLQGCANAGTGQMTVIP